MPSHGYFCGGIDHSNRAPKIGRPKRDRAKVKAGRKAARRPR